MRSGNTTEAEHYLGLEILFVNTKAACEVVKEDRLTIPNPWTVEEERGR